jgi:hypothetical protein
MSMTAEHPALGLLHDEFGGDWEICERPGGLELWTALHKENRSERYLVARSPGDLLKSLRALRGNGTG